MAIATPVLYLNTSTLQTADSSPFITSDSDASPAPSWSRVSGATGPLSVVLCTVDGGVAARTALASGNTLHFIAKADPADADMAVAIDFTVSGDSGAEVYAAAAANLAIDSDLWNGKPSINLVGNFEERNSGGDVLRIWNATLALTRGVGDGGSPTVVYFVSYNAQSPTSPQKAQALLNIGAAPLASPTFTGVPAAPTATPGTNTTQLATTAFVAAAVAAETGDALRYSAQELTGAQQVIGRRNTSSGAASLSGSVIAPFVRQSVVASVPIGTGNTSSGEFDATGLIPGMTVEADGVFIGGTTIESISGIAPNQTVTFSTPALGGGTSEIVATATVPVGPGDVVSDGTITAANAGKVAVVGSTTKQIGAGVAYTSAATVSTIVSRDGTGAASFGGTVAFDSASFTGDSFWTDGANSAYVSGSSLILNDGTSDTITLDAATGTATASIVQAGTSAGMSLRSNNGTVCASWGAGGGANFTAVALAVTADSITVNGKTLTAPAAAGQITTEERLVRQKRFAVGVSAAAISTTNSAWNSLITNGSAGVTRLHSYFNFLTSASLAGSKYTFWVETGGAAVSPQAFAGHPFYGLNFSKGLEISFPLQIAQRTSSTAVLPSDGYLSGYFGQSRNTHYEDIVQVGFGFLLKGDGTIQLQALATNGGSVVKSSFVASGLDMSVNASAVASLIRITSDTAGNLTLFVDGVSKCTLSGGPTGLTNVSTSSFAVWSFTISNGAGTPTKTTDCTIGEPLFII